MEYAFDSERSSLLEKPQQENHTKYYALGIVRRGQAFISQWHWALLLCASHVGQATRVSLQIKYLGHDSSTPASLSLGNAIPPYIIAWGLWILRLALTSPLMRLNNAPSQLEEWRRTSMSFSRSGRKRIFLLSGPALLGIRFLLQVAFVLLMVGEIYSWALTPSHLHKAISLDWSAILDQRSPVWLKMLSALMLTGNAAGIAYSAIALMVLTLHLYLWLPFLD
ncbi:hypothetical protein F5Y18DRAFT_440848 [Xylariaceae sp. FL1019]|nr:hypothetical protein F5Y18DRAFT_440848 [Xylariaceae sp. FL1019]